MKSFGLLVSIFALSLAGGCERELRIDEGPETCTYDCQGSECPELIARDLIDLHHVAADGGNVYWTVAESLYRRGPTGVVESVATDVAWADHLALAGGQAWLTSLAEPSVNQVDVATGRVITHRFRGLAVAAFEDGSARIVSDEGLYRADRDGEVLLPFDLSPPNSAIGRRGDQLLVTERTGDVVGIASIDRDGTRTSLGVAPQAGGASAIVGLADKVVYWNPTGIWVLADGDTEARPWFVGQIGDVAVSDAGALWVRRGGTDGSRVEVVAQGWNEATPRRLEESATSSESNVWVALAGTRAVYTSGRTTFGRTCAVVARPSGF